MPHDPEIQIIRSARRRRTVQARRRGQVIEVRVPQGLSRREEAELVAGVVSKLRRRESSTQISDAALLARARKLNDEVLESRARIGSVRWVHNQRQRWGSCTQSTGAVRISSRLQEVPGYVLDAVLVHELVHTFVRGGHSAEFWSWADRAPRTERARGYLEAYQRFGPGQS